MKGILGSVLVSGLVSGVLIAGYHVTTHYRPGDQVNDALDCLLEIGRSRGGHLSFDFTGVVGERQGDYRYIWILGHEEELDGASRAIQCKFTDDELEMFDPLNGRSTVSR